MQFELRHLATAIYFGLAFGGCSASAPFTNFDLFSGKKFVQVDAPTPTNNGAAVEKPDAKIVSAYANPARNDGAQRDKINFLISKYASAYNLPERFVHRVVNRESTYRAHAKNGIHLGLMQLNPQTARTMGYRGDNLGLLDAETNLKYGVKYLAGAYLVAKGDEDRADKLYQTGYYYHAKRMGLLRATGLRP